MEEQRNPFSGKKIEFRRSPALLKIVLTALILFSMAALVALRWVHNGILQQTDRKRQEAAAVEYDNEVLEDKIKHKDSVEGIQGIAQEQLGLEDPDSILIDPE